MTDDVIVSPPADPSVSYYFVTSAGTRIPLAPAILGTAAIKLPTDGDVEFQLAKEIGRGKYGVVSTLRAAAYTCDRVVITYSSPRVHASEAEEESHEEDDNLNNIVIKIGILKNTGEELELEKERI